MKKPSDAELASVPEAVRRFMDPMLSPLETIAGRSQLELFPYHRIAPTHQFWLHNIYGSYRGWEVTVQVYVTEASALERKAQVFLLFLVGAFDQRSWHEFEEERAQGIDGISSAVRRLVARAREVSAKLPPAGTRPARA